MSYATGIFRVEEKPGWEIEQTSGGWILWGPCCRDDLCSYCGGTNLRAADGCGSAEGSGLPSDPDMIVRHIGLRHWTPVRIQ